MEIETRGRERTPDEEGKRMHSHDIQSFNTCRNKKKQLVERSKREPKRTRGHPKDQS